MPSGGSHQCMGAQEKPEQCCKLDLPQQLLSFVQLTQEVLPTKYIFTFLTTTD